MEVGEGEQGAVGKLAQALAHQELADAPGAHSNRTFRYVNTKTGKPFIRNELAAFAKDDLGVDVIFWSVDPLWLRR